MKKESVNLVSCTDDQRRERRQAFFALILLTAVWALTQLINIHSPLMLDDVDSIHSEAAREMLTRSDYVTLYCDGIRYLDKPPLPYWMSAGSMAIFGQSDWACRLPLALASLAMVLYLFGFARRLWGTRAGFYSALVFATSIGPFLFTRFFIPDILVALWMTMTADLTLRMCESIDRDGRAKHWQSAAFGLVITAGMLTKGLIGCVFPIGLLAIWLLIRRLPEREGGWLAYLWAQLKLLFKMRPLTLLATWIVTALPWHILAAVRNPPLFKFGGWFWFYFINDQINRYLNKRIPRDYDKVPFALFWLELLIWLMPWGLFLIGALRKWWKTKKIRWATPELMCVTWALMILIFFSFSTRQEYYTLPAVPALAMLVGLFLKREEEGDELDRFWGRLGMWIMAGVFGAAAAVSAVLAVISKTPKAGVDLYDVVTRNPQNYALSFGHFTDLTTESMGFFRAPLAGTAVAFGLGTLAVVILRMKKKFFAANLVLAASMALFLNCAQEGYRIFNPILSSAELSAPIMQHWQAGDTLVVDGQYSDASSVNFYTRQPISMLNGRTNNLWYGSYFPDAPHRFEDDASFAKLWAGAGRVFLITDKEPRANALLADGRTQIVVKKNGRWLLINHN